MTHSPLNTGIIGAGEFARYTLAAYAAYCPDVSMQAIASRTRSKAAAVRDDFGIATLHDDNDALLADPAVEAVLLMTPPTTHFDLACRALAAGKHVLVDKPVAFTREQIDDLIDRARRADRQITTNLVLRVHPLHGAIRELCRTQELGRLRQVATTALLARYPADHWYWKPEISGGFFLNTFSHFLDLYDYLLDATPQACRADGDPENGYMLHAHYADGARAGLQASLQVDNDNEVVQTHYVFDRGIAVTEGWLPTRLQLRPEAGPAREQTSRPRDEEYQRALAVIMQNLCRRVRQPQAPTADGIDLETIRQSVYGPLAFQDAAAAAG